jgi:hypothetical protein
LEITTIDAKSDDEAVRAAKVWAATLGLAPGDDVGLRIRLPSGALKAFLRGDF